MKELITALLTAGVSGLVGVVTFWLKGGRSTQQWNNERQLLSDVQNDRQYWKTQAEKLQHQNDKLQDEIAKLKGEINNDNKDN